MSTSTPRDCDWTILARSGSQYQIRFTYFDLPVSSGCSTNSLTIYDGLTETSLQLAKLCGDICQQRTVQLNGQFTHVKMHIGSSNSAFRGFQAIVERIPSS